MSTKVTLNSVAKDIYKMSTVTFDSVLLTWINNFSFPCVNSLMKITGNGHFESSLLSGNKVSVERSLYMLLVLTSNARFCLEIRQFSFNISIIIRCWTSPVQCRRVCVVFLLKVLARSLASWLKILCPAFGWTS